MSFQRPSYPVGHWSGGVNLTHLNTDEQEQHKGFFQDLLSLPKNTTVIAVSYMYQARHFQLLPFFILILATQSHLVIELFI